MANTARIDQVGLRDLVNTMKADQEALAKTAPTIVNSPAAQAVGGIGRNVVAGAALPFAAASDVGAKALNVGNWALGGDANFFPTDATSRVVDAAAGDPAQLPSHTTPATPLGIKTLTPHVPGDAAPLNASRAVEAPAPGAATGIWAGESSPIASVTGPLNAEAATALNNRVDWSPGSENVRGIAAASDYAEEVANARRVETLQAQPKTEQEILLGIQSGNTTWGMKPDEQKAMAARIAKQGAETSTAAAGNTSKEKIAETTGAYGLKSHQAVADAQKQGMVDAAEIAGAAKVEAAQATNSTEKAKFAADAKIKAAEIAANAPAVKEQAAADALIAGQLGIGLEQVKNLREAGGTFKKKSGFLGFRKPAGFYDAVGNLLDPNSAGSKKLQVGKYTVTG